ncbi:Transmembrane amino acid transporter [Paratrimastix pyriformis]|uniref:Transmembrane amino acid transporter n=1 Tax=Paratrimastix pyriformis TaxID=342808 RepID=A0ABQ8UWD5_9EUKA|nr:Transmembrane amino acid transporter [Paratrimastix pyriformis]
MSYGTVPSDEVITIVSPEMKIAIASVPPADDAPMSPASYGDVSGKIYGDDSPLLNNPSPESAAEEATALINPPIIGSAAAAIAATPKSSNFRAWGNMMKSFIGSGVLGLPFAFKLGGLVAALAVFPLICCICAYTMFILVDAKRFCADRGVCTYGGVGRAAFGRVGGIIVNTALLSYQIGCCCTYQIFISSNMNMFVPSIDGRIWIAIFLTAFIVVAMNRSLKFLAPFSLVANLLIFGGLTIFLISSIVTKETPIDWHDISLFNWAQFPLFFGITIYAFEGTGLVIPIEATMKTPMKYKSLLASVLATVCAIYMLFGGLLYVLFGSQTNRIISRNFPDGPLKVIVVIIFMICLFVTYQLMIFPVFEAFDRMRWMKRPAGWKFKVKSCVMRACLVVVTALLAALIPDFAAFVSLVGASAGTCISFLFPPLLHYKIMRKSLPLWRKVADWALMGFSLVVLCLCTGTTIVDIIEGGGGEGG